MLTWRVRIRSKPLGQRSRRWLSVNVPCCRVNFEMFHLNELVLFQCHLVLDDRLARRYRRDAHRDVLTVEWRLGTVAVVESFAKTKTEIVEKSSKTAQGGGFWAKTRVWFSRQNSGDLNNVPIAERSKSSDIDCGRRDLGSNPGEGRNFFYFLSRWWTKYLQYL